MTKAAGDVAKCQAYADAFAKNVEDMEDEDDVKYAAPLNLAAFPVVTDG